MKTRHQFRFTKFIFNGFVKASLLAIGSVIMMAVLMTLATKVAYASSGLTPSITQVVDFDECTGPMDADLFIQKKDEISLKYFEETRYSMALSLLDNYCLSSAQANELMKLFSFDKTRTDFAYHAIYKVVDPQNFMVCKNSFVITTHSEVIDEVILDYQTSLSR